MWPYIWWENEKCRSMSDRAYLTYEDLVEMRGRLCKTADGGVGWMDESSVPVHRLWWGESRRKNSYGDSLPLVERTADAKTSKNAV